MKKKGYFIKSDGTKSTDMEKTGQKRKSNVSPGKKGAKKPATDRTKNAASNPTNSTAKKGKGKKASSDNPNALQDQSNSETD